jgi:RNA polymerase sigma-70 factor, ECF subfamily
VVAIRHAWLRAVPAPAVPGDGEVEDRAVVRGVLDGDVEAFGRLVERHGARLFALCVRLSGDRAVGEELAQEALARAFERLGSYREDAPVGSWLLRIALNGCRDYLKSAARRESPAEVIEAAGATRLDPEREALARGAVAALERAVRRLPPPQREAFLLFHVEGLPYETICAVTGARLGALKVRVHRARESLRRSLAGWLDGEET